jgi:isoleucyl-tRNA synthetase
MEQTPKKVKQPEKKQETVKSSHSIMEEDILKLWKNSTTYSKSVKKNENGPAFYFMDGPPYASGYIHIGTALNKALKDIAMRSRRIMGYKVFDRPGYDTHGVPIELKVEKELGLKSKQEIEQLGVDKFVAECKKCATKYIDAMNNEFTNLGVWMDWSNPYLTFSNEWIEAIWAAFKEADKKGLLYLGKYPVHVCSRCGTAVAFNEIEYEKRKDTSIYVKFPVKGRKNTFLIIWTTTPWTLPANTGVMVHPDVIYQELEMSDGEHWIMAKERVPAVMTMMERGFTLIKELSGKELVGAEYTNPLAEHIKMKPKNSYRVVPSARYVTTEEGSGMVHCAPGHGKEDYEVGKQNKLEVLSPVSIDGMFTEEAGKYAGKKVLETNTEIINDLKESNSLAHEQIYEHDYPMCWRDKTALIMISQPQWFLKISEIQKKLLAENEEVVWLPDWVKLRMKAWLEGISDWPVSRQRYWGTPLPIWYDPKTEEKIIIGSIAELEKLSGMKVKDVHKPGIDEITIRGKKSVLRRVPEVMDVWFDSGVASWAALGYPSRKDLFEEFWPADLNIEGKDQIRGWWNSQMILSEILFGKKPFDNIVMHGMVLGLGKKKLSKSSGNALAPEEIITKYGRDYLRYYFAKVSKGEDFVFDEKEFADLQRVFSMLSNINSFANQLPSQGKANAPEDKWIESKYNSLLERIEESYKQFKFFDVVQAVEEFMIHDLSRGYIQIIRDRSDETGQLVQKIRGGLLIVLSPIIPFLTENIWQDLRSKGYAQEESVHLTNWPASDKKLIDKDLEKEFEDLFGLLEIGLADRDAAKIGLRWPLASATLVTQHPVKKDIQQILARQLNVKKIVCKKGEKTSIILDTVITSELEAEGYMRELARKIQSERKKAGFTKNDLIGIKIFADAKTNEMLLKFSTQLQERVNAKNIEFNDGNVPEGALGCSVKERQIFVVFS